MIETALPLKQEIESSITRLRRLGEAEVMQDRGAGKWVRKEILGHLIDSAINNHQRFMLAQFENPFAGPGYRQSAWVAMHAYRSRPWSELLDIWLSLNRAVLYVLEGMPAEKLDTVCHIGDEKPATLAWVIDDYLRHMKYHLNPILEDG